MRDGTGVNNLRKSGLEISTNDAKNPILPFIDTGQAHTDGESAACPSVGDLASPAARQTPPIAAGRLNTFEPLSLYSRRTSKPRQKKFIVDIFIEECALDVEEVEPVIRDARRSTKMNKISMFVGVFSLCLAQQAQAGAISISNRNCAWQGLARTNQVKFHLRGTWAPIEKTPKNVTWSSDCSSDWITLHVGTTQTLQVAEWLNFDDVTSIPCKYAVEAEGASFSPAWVMGKDISRYVCELDGWGVCQCRTE